MTAPNSSANKSQSADSAPANSGSWAIDLKNLRLGYGDHIVLDNINAQIKSGAITAVLGESGGGKSTLLRHIIGLARPMAGQILYDGKDIFSLPQKQFRRIRRRFGVLFQDGALLGSLTLAENVGLPLSENTNLSPKIIRKAAIKTLSLVGLQEAADLYPNQLSGGMRKRGGLARAIITAPPILFCDEPTSGLDPINSAQMDSLLLDMKARFPNMTIVLVTHDLTSAARISDEVLLIGKGKLLFCGTYEELKNSPDPYLHSFVERKAQEYSQYNEEKDIKTDIDTDAALTAALSAWLEE